MGGIENDKSVLLALLICFKPEQIIIPEMNINNSPVLDALLMPYSINYLKGVGLTHIGPVPIILHIISN